MNSRTKDVLLLVGLVVIGVALRLGFRHIPNFAPVAAIALFAGYAMRNPLLAVAAPLLVMLISDSQIGGYHTPVMVTVYACLTLPVLFRGPLRKYLPLEGDNRLVGRLVGPAAGLVGCSLAASIVFFVATNFAVWYSFDFYPRNAAGLATCYGQALPFFRYTLAGDLLFAFTLFGGYALCQQLLNSGSRERLIRPAVVEYVEYVE